MSSRQFIKWRAILSSFMLMFVTSLSFIPSASAQGETYTYVTPTDIRAEGGVLSTPAKLVPDPAGLSNAFGGASTFSGGITYPGVPRAKDSTLAGVVCNTTLTITPNGGSGTADSTTGADVQPGGTNQRNGNLCPAPGISTSISIGKANLYGPGGACVPTGTDQVVGPQCAAQGGVALQPDPQNKGQYINPGADGTGGTATGDVTATCEGGALTWIVCPLIAIVQKGISILSGWVQAALVVTPLNTNSDDGLYKAWSAMRNLADVFFILIFFVVIFGTGIGLDNYSVKKILPRLMAAAILVQFSYILCGVAIDIANVLGLGLSQLIAAGVGTQATAGNSVTKQVLGSIEGLALLGGSAALAVSVGAIVPVGLAVLSAILSLLAAFVTLEVRVLLINFLVVISPFAFVLWVLPNTAKYFKEWWEFFSKLLIMFPIIMLLLTVANLLSVVAQSAGANLDILQQILAAVVPIIVFFLIPATFKLAGSALNLGHNMVTKASGGTHKGLSGAFWSKDQQDRRKLAGQQKLMALRDKGPGSSTLGKLTQGAKGRLAQSQSGFGLGAAKGLKGLQMNRALDKTASELAQSNATEQYHAQYGKPTYEKTIANRQAAEVDKMLTQNANEAFLNQEVEVKGKDGVISSLKIKDVDLDGEGIKSLQQKVQAAVDSGDHATAIAAMTKLSQSQSGEDALQELRMGGNADNNVRAVFGGSDTKVAIDDLKDVWSKGTANAKSPDFRKPANAAWSDLSADEITTMSSKQVKRALSHYERGMNSSDTKVVEGAQKAAEQFSTNFQKVLANPNLAGKINPNSVEAVQEYGTKDRNNKPIPPSTYVKSSWHQAAAQVAEAYTDAKKPAPAPQPNAQSAFSTPAQPTATPLVTPTPPPTYQPNIVTAPRAGTTFRQPAQGGLYIPSSYQPPTTNPHPPKIDPAAEEHRDDHIGDDRSIS